MPKTSSPKPAGATDKKTPAKPTVKPKTARKATAKAAPAAQVDPLAPQAAAFSKLEVWANKAHHAADLALQVIYVETAFVDTALELIRADERLAGVVVEAMPIQALGTKKALLASLTPLRQHLRAGMKMPQVDKPESPATAPATTAKDVILNGVNDIVEGVTVAGRELASAGLGKLSQGLRKVNRYLEERH